MPEEKLQQLFEKYLHGQCSPEELRELSAMALMPGNEPVIRALLEKGWNVQVAAEKMPDEKAAFMLRHILRQTRPSARIRYLPWRRSAVAAAILLLLGAAGYFLLMRNTRQAGPPAIAARPPEIKAPAGNHARIMIAGSRTIYLDSLANGQQLLQDNIVLEKQADGQIAYRGPAGKGEMSYNTLINPRGSRVINILLSDGTRAWLNAGSSMTYPAAFTANERKVEINGEAYFEVAPGARRPFKVSKGATEVRVLGTHFNVNAYDDEAALTVTLLEGAVSVSDGQQSAVLAPGQQAVAATGAPLLRNDEVDLEAVMAWKNGRFSFDRADIKNVMRQLARWYDLDVEYKGPVTGDLFGGDIQKDLPLSQVLDFLKKSQVHFNVSGRKVIVMP